MGNCKINCKLVFRLNPHYGELQNCPVFDYLHLFYRPSGGTDPLFSLRYGAFHPIWLFPLIPSPPSCPLTPPSIKLFSLFTTPILFPLNLF